MNKGVMRAISLFMSSAMFISSLPVVMAENNEENSPLFSMNEVQQYENIESETADIELMSDDNASGREGFFLDASEVEIGSYTETFTVSGVTIYATSSKKVDVDSNSKPFSDGTKITRRIKLGGAPDFNTPARYLEFTPQYNGTVTVYAAHASSTGDPRMLTVGNGILECPANSTVSGTFEVNAGEAVKIYGSGGINIYGVRYEPAAPLPETDEEWANLIKEELTLSKVSDIENPEAVTDDFTLEGSYTYVVDDTVSKEASIVWKSNSDAVTVNGKNASVTRPSFQKQSVSVKLTAEITVGDASVTKEFNLTVLKWDVPETDEDKIVYAEEQLEKLNFNEEIDKVVTSSIHLPDEITLNDLNIASISWTSSDTSVMSNDGALLRIPESGETFELNLTAVITAGGQSKTLVFPIVIRSNSSAKAFPGAQGYGTQTRGGAKGYIYHVTSLGATGPGTLHEALEVKTGARTIVFDVGGTIDLTPLGRALKMSGEDDSNVTIAGQTAPGNGIQLKGYGMTLSNVHDVIIRHISIRIGNVRKAGDTYQSDPLSATGANKRVVLDHLSMCWAVDMGFRVYGNEMTMSNCMVSKGLYWNTPHEKGKHNYAGIFGAKYGTFYGNYIADCGQRAPRICDNEYIDVRNNVVFNSKYTFDICNYEWMGANPKFNVVGNVVLKGNPSPGDSSSNVSSGGSYKYFQGRVYSGGLFAYSANNYDNTKNARAINDNDSQVEGALWTGEIDAAGMERLGKEMSVYNAGGYSNIAEPWRDMVLPSDISLDEYDDSAISKEGNTLVNYPFVIPSMKTYSGSDTVKYVLSNAGAKAPVRGILDNRYLAEARTRLQILSDYSKASKRYGIKLAADYAGEKAYGLDVETHTIYEDRNGMTVYDVNGNTVDDASDMTIKEQYKFVSCENDLDTLYAVDNKGNKYRLELREYTDADDIYDAFELYDAGNNKLTKPSSYASTDTMNYNGNISMKYADWGDGAGNYNHKNSSVSDGNLDTSIVDTEWSEEDWPQLPVAYRDGDFDSNGDGIPDFFIKLMGWDKHPQYSSNKDISRLDFEGRGYTNLEYYINDYCAGDMELEDSTENDVIEAENVRDGSSRYNTHRSHEILFNTSRRAKAKVYYCEGEEFDLNSAKEIKLNSEYNVNNKLYSDPGDYDTYFSAVISDGDKGLKPDTTYSYKIKTYSDTGVECMSSETYTFKTLSESSGKPGTPRVLKYIPYDKQITVIFEPSSPAKSYTQTVKSDRLLTKIASNDYDSKTDHYVLKYSENADLSNAKEVKIPVTATRYVLAGLSNDKEYYLDLRAVSADGTESDPAVYNKKKSQASGDKDKDGNDVYTVKSISVNGNKVQEYYDDYEHVFSTLPIQPTLYVVNENYKKTLKESEIGEGETTKFISIYGDEKDWYIYTLGGIPIPTIAEGDTDPMLMLRDDSHDHGFTYAKKFDTLLDGKSTIHARLMIKGETLDPMNQSPELRFYIQQDSAAEEDEDKTKNDGDDDNDKPQESEEDEEGGDNNATTFGNIVSLQFTKNEILYNGGDSVARYEDDVWYDIKFLMDADNGTCSIYINDSLVGKDMEYSASATSNSIARWQISSRLAGTEDVYIDYMYAYKGWEEPVTDPDATPKPDNTVQEGTSGFKPAAGGGGGGGGGGDKTTSTPKPSEEPANEPTNEPVSTNAPDDSANSENNSSDNVQNNKNSHFKDMGGYEWAVEAVNELHDRGIAYGMTEELFAPDREITRAEFVTLLMRGFELIGEDASCNFDDVPDGSWYYPAVAMAYSMGVVNGYSQTMFGANDKVSRQDMAAIVTRLMSKLGFELPTIKSYESFDDDSLISDYAKDAVKGLYEAGIINGVGYNQFDPLGTANRAAAAKILYSTLKIQWDKQEQ